MGEKGTVLVPKEYFLKMAKADYRSYREALAREFYQNSIDAGAANIYVDVDEISRSIVISDDGCGMDYDIVKNKLLVFGGSHKAEGSVGAFGKAKEVLFFAWDWYEIKTQDLVVTGVGAEFEIDSGQPWVYGVVATIKIQESENLSMIVDAFRTVAERIETTTVIKVNGKEQELVFPAENLVYSSEKFKMYFSEGGSRYTVTARINGIWMFDHWTSEVPGKIIIELRDSRMLTSNRDGLSGVNQTEFNKIIADIIQDQQRMLHPKPQHVVELIKGTGPLATIDDAIEKVKEMAASIGLSGAVTEFLAGSGVPEQISALRVDKDSCSYSRLAMAGYRPDFVLKYETALKDGATAFISTKKASNLANAWSEVVRQVLLDNEKYLTFRVGFIFSEDSEAEAGQHEADNLHMFLINPKALISDVKDHCFSVSAKKSAIMADLRLKACHEIAHMETNYHNESFVQEMHKLISNTWKSEKTYMEIKKAYLN